jgi:hypothetical protein
MDFKYLGFFLNLTTTGLLIGYGLLKRLSNCVSIWVNHLLSRGGRLVLLKSVIKSISMYWTSITMVPKGILSKIRKVSFQFLMVLTLGEMQVSHWLNGIRWLSPRSFKDWGLKIYLILCRPSLLEVYGGSLRAPPYGEEYSNQSISMVFQWRIGLD